MASTNCFALTTSQLNPFLFAEVGTEMNGSTLTVLSVLARQGKDAWAEAASWVGRPRSEVIESLARSIATMPLAADDLAAAPTTAARLVELLPHPGQAGGVPGTRTATSTLQAALPGWLPQRYLYVALALALGINLLFSHHVPTPAPAPLAQLAQPAAVAAHQPQPPAPSRSR